MRKVMLAAIAALILAGCPVFETNPFPGLWRAPEPLADGEYVYWQIDEATVTEWYSYDTEPYQMPYTYDESFLYLVSGGETYAMSYSFSGPDRLTVAYLVPLVFDRQE